MGLKLDVTKAFNQMEWSFILKIFSLLAFHQTWINWIHQCLFTVPYSILLDGSPFGKFCPRQGLMQGDPLSPFLFILDSEVLSRLILEQESLALSMVLKSARQIRAIPFPISSDIMLFARANSSEASTLLNCLNLYSSWSGQSNNPFKSTISFSKNTKPESISSIQAILNLRQISPNAKYIGLPLFIQKNKKVAFEDFISKILQKITSWKAKLLSQEAKTTLIKSVDYSIPSFSMYIIVLPKSLCRGIDASIRKFWWGFNPSKRHNLTLLAWNKICSPKSVGGLGICTMEYQNLSPI